MYIFTHRTLSPSARALATALEVRLGVRIPVYFENSDRTSKHKSFLRWGNSSEVLTNNDSDYNSSEGIFISSNKLRFSRRVIELGIPCVEIHTGVPDKYPVVIRKLLTGSGGAGIEICKSKSDYLEKYNSRAWSYWYELNPELGVHVFGGKIIKIFKKVRNENLPQEEFPIRNLTRGYKFVRASLDNYPKLIPYVKNFSDKFDIKFGRIDIGWDRQEKIYRIIEMNTAPGIASNSDTLAAYVNEFEVVLKSRIR